MTTSTARLFDAVDLDGLPAPDVIEELDYEAALAQVLAEFEARYPAFDALVESDPAMKIAEAVAYAWMLARARVNDAARAVLLATATGADLDHLAALFGLARLTVTAADPAAIPPRAAVLETDAALRRRVQLSLEAATAAGTAGRYLFYALGADPDVRDASITSPTPGTVLVTVLSAQGDGTPSAGLLAAVDAVMQDEEVRQLCDTVEVQAAQLVPVDVEAVLHYRPGAAREAARDAALARLDALAAAAPKLGRPVARSEIFAALHVEGIARVELASPAADLTLSPVQAMRIASTSVTDA